jgi:hypothetical protein
MPRDYFEYTKEKLLSFQHQITELLGSDFPIPATKNALFTIQAIFTEEAERLSTLSNFAPEVKKAACANANLKIKKFLPLLGFILRSTNVRNSFELTDPITRLAKRILKRELTFVLSSEWDFSPLTYTFSFKELPDVILLGLPSFESANALIVPLAGHELGHWIWRHQDLESQLVGELQENVLNFYRDEWPRFCKVFWEKEVGDIQTDTSIRDVWTISFAYSIRQCEELFADFMGLRLFGASYLHSFEYLVAPFTGETRSRDYPDMRTRAEFLEKAAARFSISPPDHYVQRFDDSTAVSDPADEFLLEASDAATRESADQILSLVETISNDGDFPRLSEDKTRACLSRISVGMPAEEIDYIGDIVNAGWAAYRDETIIPASAIGERRRVDVLNELLLKSIEVAEVEARMREHNVING